MSASVVTDSSSRFISPTLRSGCDTLPGMARSTSAGVAGTGGSGGAPPLCVTFYAQNARKGKVKLVRAGGFITPSEQSVS